MNPAGGEKSSGELLAQIEKYFDSFDNFANALKTAAATQTWFWLGLACACVGSLCLNHYGFLKVSLVFG